MERFDMQVIVEYMYAAFALGKPFSFTPSGDSMLPTLQNGTDTVTVVPADACKIGDIILYRRPSGMYVLHRIVGKAKRGFMLCGDNENTIEYPIPQKDMLAKVISATDANGNAVDLHAKSNPGRLWLKKLKLHIRLLFKK